jgi:hypothetical protein
LSISEFYTLLRIEANNSKENFDESYFSKLTTGDPRDVDMWDKDKNPNSV